MVHGKRSNGSGQCSEADSSIVLLAGNENSRVGSERREEIGTECDRNEARGGNVRVFGVPSRENRAETRRGNGTSDSGKKFREIRRIDDERLELAARRRSRHVSALSLSQRRLTSDN